MTVKEAMEALRKAFPNRTHCVHMDCWKHSYHGDEEGAKTHYRVTGFDADGSECRVSQNSLTLAQAVKLAIDSDGEPKQSADDALSDIPVDRDAPAPYGDMSTIDEQPT